MGTGALPKVWGMKQACKKEMTGHHPDISYFNSPGMNYESHGDKKFPS